MSIFQLISNDKLLGTSKETCAKSARSIVRRRDRKLESLCRLVRLLVIGHATRNTDSVTFCRCNSGLSSYCAVLLFYLQLHFTPHRSVINNEIMSPILIFRVPHAARTVYLCVPYGSDSKQR
jgi:hypothetical protein